MPNQIFTPEHKSINDIFVRDIKYIIPAYQRPYSWESIGKNDANSQINNMWDDFYAFYQENNEDKEYFFGSIVVYKEKEGFQVVDGQQRLTSLLLFFAAMKCFLKDSEAIVEQESKDALINFIQEAIQTIDDTLYNKETLSLTSTLKVKIQRIGSQNFDDILQKSVKCDDKNAILPEKKSKNQTIALRYFNNRDFLVEKLKEIFIEKNRFTRTKAEEFDKFWRFLRNKISIVFIQTTNFETAYNIFEVLNNRGLPLTNLDLFKNFFISTCEQEGDGEGKWEGLETDYHLNGDFLGRFIESENGFQMRKSAFNEIKDYYHALPGISKSQKNQIFYEKLKENLHYFTWIMEEDRIEDNPIKYEIKFIKLLGNERYSINYVMTLFKTFQYDGQHHGELLSHLKTYVQMRLYTLLKPSKRFSNSPIYKAIKALKEKEYKPAKEILALSKEEQKELEKMLDDEIHDNEFGKLLIIRYIYTCWQQQTEDFIHSELDVGKATLEHIIPQKPNKNSNWLQMDSKFRKKYTYRLGNFTLLTMKMNSTAKNYDFSQKQKEYQKTQLFITQELAKLEEITDTDIEERHKKFVEQIIDSF